MQIKEVFKNASEKTKSVLKRLLGFLNAKRFSVVTLLLTLILCLDLYSCLVPRKAREPTTASASVLENDGYFIVIPSVRCNLIRPSQVVRNCEVSTMFMGCSDIYNPYISINSIYHFVEDSQNVNGNYYSIPLDNTFVEYFDENNELEYTLPLKVSSPISFQVLFVRDRGSDNYDFNANTYLISARVVVEYTYDAVFSRDYVTRVPNNLIFNAVDFGYAPVANGWAVSNDYRSLVWEFCYNQAPLFVVYLQVPSTSNGWQTDGFNFRYTTISAELLGDKDYYYELGYSEGYFQSSLDGASSKTPISVIVDGVNDFLDIEIFGGVKLSLVLQLAFGLVLLGIVIKVFLGG